AQSVPEEWQPVPTAFERAVAAGVPAFVVGRLRPPAHHAWCSCGRAPRGCREVRVLRHDPVRERVDARRISAERKRVPRAVAAGRVAA
ncbi:hypothetical protein DZG03_17630, partial [Clavibacter phaseoli]